MAGWITAGLIVEDGLDAKRLTQLKAARRLEHLGAAHMSIPSGDAPELEQRGWLKDLQGKLAAGKPVTAEMLNAISQDLRARLILRGHAVEKSTKAAAWVVRDVAIVETAIGA